jgi:hypothetical protein
MISELPISIDLLYQILMSDHEHAEPLLSKPVSVRKSKAPAPGSLAVGFLAQTKLLTYKNLLITFKNPKNILFLVVTPFILSLFLFALQTLAVQNGEILISDPSS